MRIEFSKTGTARFISHLDLMRTFTRSLKRAGVPVTHTQGFNPHPYLVFSPPLSLGVESRCELLDFRLDEPIEPRALQAMLEGVFPSGIELIEVYEQQRKLNDIAFARYTLSFSEKRKADFDRFISQPQILAERHAKKGRTVTVDLKEAYEPESETENSVTFLLPCGNEKNTSVNLLSDTFRNFAKITDEPVSAFRLDFLDCDKNKFM